MRSERDIKRTPRRPVARATDANSPAPAPRSSDEAPEARPAEVKAVPGQLDAQGRPVVAVSIRPAGDRAPRAQHDRGSRPQGDRPPRAQGDRPPRPQGDRPFKERGATERDFHQRGFKDRGFDDRGFNDRSVGGGRGDRGPQGGERPGRGEPERGFGDRGFADRGFADRGIKDHSFRDRGFQDRGADHRGPRQSGPGARFVGRPEGARDERRPERPGPRPDFRQDAQGRAPRFDDEARRAPNPAGPTRIRKEDYRPAGPRPQAPARPLEDGVRLSKVLGDRGLASRREADDWIAAGWVRVDGEMAVLGQRVQPDARIEIDPAAHQQQAKRVTVLINKPIGYVSGQAEDGYEPASVLITQANHWDEDTTRKPFHPGHARGLAPAGRLDIDSTGLLVLTQDGRIAKHLIGEDSDVEKEYLVRVELMRDTPFTEDDLALLNHGLELDGKKLKPAKVSWANEDQLRFCLREGRKRQIRRMCELVGLKVTALKRVRIGSVVLGKLPPGQWRYLRDDERF